MQLPVRIEILRPRLRRQDRFRFPGSLQILRAAVKILCIDFDDIEIVTQLSGLGRKAQVGNRGDGDGADLEAVGPVFVVLVLQIELERGVLVVGEACFGGLRCAPYSSSLPVRNNQHLLYSDLVEGQTYRASGQLVGFPIVGLVVWRLAIA